MFRSNYRSAPAPYRLLFYLTRRCNCRCQICRIWETEPGPEISLEEVQKIFKNASSHLRWLHLSGGEIFLRDDIYQIMKTAAKDMPRLFLLQFATNCTLPERIIEACRIISQSNIPKLVVTLSIDGVGTAHDEQRGIPGLFNRAIGLYHRIKEEYSPRVEPYLGLTITRSNAGMLSENIRELRENYGVARGDIHYNFYHQSDMYYQNDDSEVLIPDQAKRTVNLLNRDISLKERFSPGRWLGFRYRRLYPGFLRSGRGPYCCEAFSGSLSIDSDGECYPCMSYQRSAGHIKNFDYDLRTLWSSRALRKIRKEIEKNLCPQCWTPCEAYQTILTHALPGHKS